MNRLVEPIEVAHAIGMAARTDEQRRDRNQPPGRRRIYRGAQHGTPMADCGKFRNAGRKTMNIETPRKKLDLTSAIAEGDIRVLLMVLVHMTGDLRWLNLLTSPGATSA